MIVIAKETDTVSNQTDIIANAIVNFDLAGSLVRSESGALEFRNR